MTAAAARATLIAIPPMIDSEFARFLLVHYGVPYVEEPHSFGFAEFYTLLRARTLVAPVVYGTGYSAVRARAMVRYFEPLAPPDRRLLRTDPAVNARIEADMRQFDGTLSEAVRQYAYGILLPMRGIMIEPLTRGCPRVEQWTISLLYPALAAFIRWGLKISPANVSAALARVRGIMDEVSARLAGGARFLVDDQLSLSDLAFVTAAAPLVMPEYDGAAAPAFAQLPPEMRAIVAGFRAHPAGLFVQRIYRDYRRG